MQLTFPTFADEHQPSHVSLNITFSDQDLYSFCYLFVTDLANNVDRKSSGKPQMSRWDEVGT